MLQVRASALDALDKTITGALSPEAAAAHQSRPTHLRNPFQHGTNGGSGKTLLVGDSAPAQTEDVQVGFWL